MLERRKPRPDAVQGGKVDAENAHIVTIVDWLLQYAFDQRASDIHLEPRRDMGAIRFRIDGVLHTVYQVPMTVMNAMTARIKLLGRMDVVERRRPQDGRIKTVRPEVAGQPGGDGRLFYDSAMGMNFRMVQGPLEQFLDAMAAAGLTLPGVSASSMKCSDATAPSWHGVSPASECWLA